MRTGIGNNREQSEDHDRRIAESEALEARLERFGEHEPAELDEQAKASYDAELTRWTESDIEREARQDREMTVLFYELQAKLWRESAERYEQRAREIRANG